MRWESERSDARGMGRTLPIAPPGLSRSDWGLDEKRAQRVATQGVWGERSPIMPHRGCPVRDWGLMAMTFRSRTEGHCLDHPQGDRRWSGQEQLEAAHRNSAEEPESCSAEPGMPAAAPELTPPVPPE